METYLGNKYIIIPTEIKFNTVLNKKSIKFPNKWSSIKTVDDSRTVFESYRSYTSFAILTGEINNITVIDVDNPEIWDNLNIEYPDSGIRVQTNKGFHLYFEYEPTLKTRSNIIEGIDIRNNGGNAIIPPSFYEIDGERYDYTFIDDSIETAIQKLSNLPKIPEALLEKLTESVKKKVIKIELPSDVKIRKVKKALDNTSDRYYNSHNNIKNLAYALVNCSSKINVDMKKVYTDYCNKGTVYQDEYEELWNDTQVNSSIGFNYLNNILRNYKLTNLETMTYDSEVLIGLLSKKKDLVIDYMNRHFGVITSNDNGKILYCELEYKNKQIINIILISSKDNFINKIANDIKIEVSEDKYKSVNKYWLDSSNRNEYRKMVFEPGIECYGNLNMFLGFNFITDKNCIVKVDKLSFIFKHIKVVICDNNEISYEYLLNWLSHIVQYPTVRMGVAVVCKSIQGAGKNIFFENLMGSLIIGKNHAICISDTDQIVGKFNAVLERMIYTVVNELKADGDMIKMSNLLKSLITDTTQKIEKKGIDAIHINNYNNFVFLSNNHSVVNVEMYDRRYFCLSCSSGHINDKTYFKDLCDNMLNEDIAQEFYNYLIMRDLSKFDFRDIPLTEYKKQLTYNSIPAIMKWFNEYIKDCIEEKIDEQHVKLKILCEKYKEQSLIGKLNIGTFQRQLTDEDKGIGCIRIQVVKNITYMDFNVNTVYEEMKQKKIWYSY
jgi:hypothetical protein